MHTPPVSGDITRAKRGALTDDADRILRQANNLDVNNVGQLVDLVERNKADQCLYRVICELAHNSRAHGDGGAKFAKSLLKFRQSKHPKVKQYLDAMANGARSRNSDQCKNLYPKCNYATADIIIAGNKLLGTQYDAPDMTIN